MSEWNAPTSGSKSCPTHVRTYLLTDDGLRRVTTNALFVKRDLRLPQYAGSRQKAIQAVYEWRAGRLFLKVTGTYLDFDQNGRQFVSRESLMHASATVGISGQIELQRRNTPAVADFDSYRQLRALRAEASWEPSEKDRELVAADLLGSARPPGTKAIPILKPTSAT